MIVMSGGLLPTIVMSGGLLPTIVMSGGLLPMIVVFLWLPQSGTMQTVIQNKRCVCVFVPAFVRCLSMRIVNWCCAVDFLGQQLCTATLGASLGNTCAQGGFSLCIQIASCLTRADNWQKHRQEEEARRRGRGSWGNE